EAFSLRPLDEAELAKVSQSFDLLCGALKTYGPLWCAGRFFQGGNLDGGHVIVVLGAIKRKFLGTMKDCVVFHDPAPSSLQGGPFSVKQFEAYFKPNGHGKNGIYTIKETEGVSCVMHLPPPTSYASAAAAAAVTNRPAAAVI